MFIAPADGKSPVSLLISVCQLGLGCAAARTLGCLLPSLVLSVPPGLSTERPTELPLEP